MADRFGQFDNNLLGGSDAWDDGVVGQILLADYFEPISTFGRVKMWTGTAWVSVRAWTGTAWVSVRAWTGTAWV